MNYSLLAEYREYLHAEQKMLELLISIALTTAVVKGYLSHKFRPSCVASEGTK